MRRVEVDGSPGDDPSITAGRLWIAPHLWLLGKNRRSRIFQDKTLSEIVESIKSVAQIVSEIATASAEQSSGIEQVNKTLTQIDEMTQQNSAMVEENAAAARTLDQQAEAMVERLAAFTLAGHAAPEQKRSKVTPIAPRQPAKKQAVAGGPARRMQAALATAVKTDTWEEF